MCDIYSRLDESKALETLTDINTFSKARIVAETGPLNSFSNFKKLIRFAGLNLIEKDSGTVTGAKRISKKGRAPLRKVLYQIVFTAVRKNGLFHDYYTSKGGKGKGHKVMVACMRNLLRIFLGVFKSSVPYDRQRVFTCQSAYELEEAC